jgi:hypothetical protein
MRPRLPGTKSEVHVGGETMTCATVRCSRPAMILREDGVAMPLHEAKRRGRAGRSATGLARRAATADNWSPGFQRWKI